MSPSWRYTLHHQPRKKTFGISNSDVSHPRNSYASAHLNPGKNLSNSEKTSTDEITIHLVSRSSGKPAVARAAHVMANDTKWQQQRIGTQDLHAILEGVSW
jgi:hypothetical protein